MSSTAFFSEENKNETNLEAKLQAKLQKKLNTSTSVFNGWWIIAAGVVSGHLLLVYTLLFSQAQLTLKLTGIAFGFLYMFGITAGYHRLWVHRSFQCNVPCQIFLSILGWAAWQGSIKWWVLRHRLHHRFVDTDDDPYNATKGLWYSHVGWLLQKPTFMRKAHLIDMSDFNEDKVAVWATKYYPLGVILFALIFPALLGNLLFNDTVGGLLWIGVVARCISWNGIFLVNSLSHWYGDKPYSVFRSSTNNFILALMSNGEANHNFHHEFPASWIHGIKWHDYDLTKWVLWTWGKLGWAWNFYCPDDHLIKQAEIKTKINLAQMQIKHQEKLLSRHMKDALNTPFYTPDKCTLKEITNKDFIKQGEAAKKSGVCLIRMKSTVYDITSFIPQHPGGKKVMQINAGQDASKQFYGGLNNHSQSAQNLMERYAIATIKQE